MLTLPSFSSYVTVFQLIIWWLYESNGSRYLSESTLLVGRQKGHPACQNMKQ